MLYYNEDQYVFDRTRGGFGIALKILWELIIFTPLWFPGYMLSTLILNKEASVWEWIGLIVLFSILINLLLFGLKGAIANLKENGNPTWILLFTICVGLTSIVPAWVMFSTIHELMMAIYPAHADLLTWCGAIGLGVAIYLRYRF